MRIFNLLVLFLFFTTFVTAQSVFINEFHYENTGTDVNEGIEIAGPSGIDLSGWTLLMYNGANGTPYLNVSLAGIIPNLQNGFGTLNFAVNGMQNGAPDGMALVDNNNLVIQTIGYEGTFIGTAGPATGMVFQSLGSNITELPTTAVGFSLQLMGSGNIYTDFTWNVPASSTANAINNGQVFTATGTTCASSLPIGCGDVLSGTTVGGAIPSIGNCGTSITSPGAWYRYTSTSIGKITASTCGNASYDTKISIFRSDCNNLICVGGNDDGANCAGFTSEIIVNTLVNEDYFLLVHGFQSQTGSFDLSLTCGPRAICQGTFTIPLDVNGVANITTLDIDAGSDSPNGIQNLSLDKSSFDCSDIGANTVTLTVTDNAGETDSCATIVNVEDVLNPIASPIGFLDVFLDVNGQLVVDPASLEFASTDNCGIASFALDVTTFDCSDIGVNNLVFTVADSSGNTDSASCILNVLDNIDPTIIVQNITVTLDGSNQANIVPSDVDNGSTDNCSLASISIDINTFDCSNLGPNTITFTAIDVNGNSASSSVVVTVNETTPPNVITQNISVSLDSNGTAVITPADIDNGSTDNCGIDSLSLDITMFDCSDIGANNVRLTATDLSGNSGVAMATVTVVDDLPPLIQTVGLVASLDSNGMVTISPADVDDGTSDNCGLDVLSLDITMFDCTHIGVNTVIFTATDVNGNSASASTTVTITDMIDPVVVGQDITVDLGGSGSVTIAASDLNNGTTDNCDYSLTIDQDTFTAVGVYPVELTATDSSGNDSSITVMVTVVDTLGVNEEKLSSDIILYPNPTAELVNIDSSVLFEKFLLFDSNGRLLMEVKGEVAQIDLSRYPSGLYFVKFETKNTTIIKRILKE